MNIDLSYNIAHFPRCVKARLREIAKKEYGENWEVEYLKKLNELGLKR